MEKPSFEVVARRELPVLYRVAKRLTRDPVAAEDLVGQALLNAASGWDKFDGRYPRSWMIRILQHAQTREADKLSAKARHEPLDEASAIAPDVWQELDARHISGRIVVELDNLPQEFRLAVALCDMEELSYEEAAAAMDVPIGTVRSRLFRGRQILRERLAALMATALTCELKS